MTKMCYCNFAPKECFPGVMPNAAFLIYTAINSDVVLEAKCLHGSALLLKKGEKIYKW
jgi:hypothetical protein